MYLSTVKNSNKLTVKHINSNASKINNESFNFALTIPQIDSDTAVAIYNWAIGYTNLTKDTYTDCQIKTVKCVESIAGGVS